MVSKALFFKLLFVAFVGGALIGHYMLHQFSSPAETALRLSEAGLMLDGQVPYVDFLDNVTPFCLYLSLVPVFIASQCFCHPILAANILTTILFIFSATGLSLLSQLPSRRNPLKFAIWPILIVYALTTALQPVHFSQANQIFFMLLCPYIACRAAVALVLFPCPGSLPPSLVLGFVWPLLWTRIIAFTCFCSKSHFCAAFFRSQNLVLSCGDIWAWS